MKDGTTSDADKPPVEQVAHSQQADKANTIDVDAKQKL